MDYFWAFIGLLAGLGAFLFGFKVLSESIEKTGKQPHAPLVR